MLTDVVTAALPRTSRTVLDGAQRLSYGALLLALIVDLTAPDLLRDLGPGLLLLAGVIGLPHGAIDHLAWGWAAGEVRPRPRVVGLYAAAAVGAVTVALLAPLPALLVLLALSTAHFAEGEAAWARLAGRPARWPAAAAAGLAVVVLPLALRPAEVRPLLATLDPRLPEVVLSARAPLLALTVLAVVAGLLSARRDPVRLLELALVVAVAAVLAPLAAFAAWFAGWHAVRHTARLVVLDPRGADGGLRRFARSAALPSAFALAGTVALGLVMGLTGGLLVALLALTVPHTAVVARLGSALPGSGQKRQSCASVPRPDLYRTG